MRCWFLQISIDCFTAWLTPHSFRLFQWTVTQRVEKFLPHTFHRSLCLECAFYWAKILSICCNKSLAIQTTLGGWIGIRKLGIGKQRRFVNIHRYRRRRRRRHYPGTLRTKLCRHGSRYFFFFLSFFKTLAITNSMLPISFSVTQIQWKSLSVIIWAHRIASHLIDHICECCNQSSSWVPKKHMPLLFSTSLCTSTKRFDNR